MPAARTTAMTAAPRRWANARPGRARSSLDRSTLVNTGGELAGDLRRPQPGHRVRTLLFPGPPGEELLQRPVPVGGVGVAVAGQQPGQPPRDVLPADLLPPGAAGLRQQ